MSLFQKNSLSPLFVEYFYFLFLIWAAAPASVCSASVSFLSSSLVMLEPAFVPFSAVSLLRYVSAGYLLVLYSLCFQAFCYFIDLCFSVINLMILSPSNSDMIFFYMYFSTSYLFYSSHVVPMLAYIVGFCLMLNAQFWLCSLFQGWSVLLLVCCMLLLLLYLSLQPASLSPFC